ncbi:MAG: NAD-dependent DNA ligase LigA [Flavobacteriales bacterium]|nr:NAD-dependent DNA ligase LigA [Flavobacteriales bacterium]
MTEDLFNSSPKLKIDELTRELKEHNYRYYVLAEPVISDYEFDIKLKELERLENEFPQWAHADSPVKVVGGAVTKNFNTIKHSRPMLSLGNTYSKDELRDFHDRAVKLAGVEPEYVCELKFDGFAIGITYRNGTLVQALTRGDGIEGDDVTENVKTIRSIPHQLSGSYPDEFEIRGEIFMHRKAFERMNAVRLEAGEQAFANPRNSAAGTIKMQESKEVAKRPLDCFFYHVLGDRKTFTHHYQSLITASEWGLPVNKAMKICRNFDEVWSFIELWSKERKNLSFDIDGVVVKVNSFQLQDELGFTAKFPRWAIAYKFETERVATVLQKVTYQVGRTGAITPVANLKPVSILGTTVKRASLHNQDIIEQLDVREGDTVFVEKGGEIIPKIVGVDLNLRPPGTKSLTFIESCPECGTPLIRIEGEAAHYCPNEEGCPPQIKGKLIHFVSRKALDINSMGEETIDLLWEKGLLRTVADFYELRYDKIIGITKTTINELTGDERTVSIREKSAENLIRGIEDSKKIPFERVLYGLGIRFVGETVAKKITKKFKSIEALLNAGYDELVAVDEIGERIAESILDWFRNPVHLEIIAKLKDHGIQLSVDESSLTEVINKLNGKIFVVSGVFTEFSRDQIKEAIEKFGGKNSGSISSKTDYVLAGENMGPAKLEKAKSLNIPVISERDFLDMISD